MKVFLTLSAVFLSACVIRVVSPPPATPQPYQIVYEEAEVQPVIIKQVIIKRERRKIIVRETRPPRYTKPPPKVRKPPPRLRKPPPKRVPPKSKKKEGKKKGDKKKDKKLKRGQKVSSPPTPK
jgi:hypothetical protein